MEGIESKIPAYALVEATKEISINGWIISETTDAEIKNMLVTESIRQMNYQDFKDVAPFLFSYPREQHQEDFLVRPVEVSREYFEELQANARELFNLKRELVAEAKEKKASFEEVISHIEQEEVIQKTGFEVIGINQDKGEFLVLDKRQGNHRDLFLGDTFLEDELLINDYRSFQSDAAQILDAILKNGSQEVKDYIYTFFNDNYREATGILEGLEEVANYYMADNMDVTLLDEVDNTSLMWQMALRSPTFKQDYRSLDELLDEYNQYDYMRDNASQLIDYPEHLDHINTLLSKDNKAVMVKSIRGYSQGDYWTLGAIYNPSEHTTASVSNFLEHEAGAAYKGSLTQAFIVSQEDLENYGLYESLMMSDSYIFDEEKLWGREVNPTKVISQEFGLNDFVALDEAMEKDAAKVSQKEEVTLGLER